MQIEVEFSDMPDRTGVLTGYPWFWMRYVRGFMPWFHCAKSFVGERDKRFYPGMVLPVKIVLQDPTSYRHAYLCGVSPIKDTGLHLALLPEEGTKFTHKTYNGMVIQVSNARQLFIRKLDAGFMAMPWSYVSCCNWQFGIQYYGTGGWLPQPGQFTDPIQEDNTYIRPTSGPALAPGELIDEFNRLTERALPRMATRKDWPLTYSYAYKRILYDAVLGGAWHKYIAKPAYRHLTTEQMQMAVDLAKRIIQEGLPLVEELLRRSNNWREHPDQATPGASTTATQHNLFS